MTHTFLEAIQYFIVFAIPISLIFMTVRIYMLKKKGKKINVFFEIVLFFLILYLIGLFCIVFKPMGDKWHRYNLIPFVDIIRTLRGINIINYSYSVSEIFLNAILFMPFGFLFTLLLRLINKLKFKTTLLFGFSLTLFIECVQFICITGRVANIDDVIINTLGSIIGYFICILFIKVFKIKPLASAK